ncbi:hypothetical protein Tco_0941642 [Tanacetum coccineum]|uniref:Reverse transcriptase domain-containing protein n=1 Tax=Tanacetum coccineum TaxID=301880 RepID=A0ABQ5DTW1_9ASTR
MTSKATLSIEIIETGTNKIEPLRFEQDVQEKPHDDKSSSIPERTTQPLVKPQQVRKPKPTIPNLKGEIKAITTRSGVAYEGPSNPTKPSPKKVVERETEEITDEEQNDFQGSNAQIPPPVIPKPIPKPEILTTLPKLTPIPEPEIPKTVPNVNISYPSRRDNQKNREKALYQKENIFQMFQDLRFDISFADALFLMPRFAPTIRDLLMNKEKLLELVKMPLNENCSAMLLKKLPEKLGDPVAIPPSTSEPFTSEFTLEEIDAFLYDKSISLESIMIDCDPRKTIMCLTIVNDDPFQLPPIDLKQSEVTEAKSSIEEPPDLELKDLPSHLEYAYLEENDKLPVIIAKGLKNDKKEALINVLKSHKCAIAWKITDIKGIDPRFCTHKILMED